jgi:hypothetical protein
MPYDGSFVSLRGSLTDVNFVHDDRHQGVDCFLLMVEHILSESLACAGVKHDDGKSGAFLGQVLS